jgi:hypothetical protein
MWYVVVYRGRAPKLRKSESDTFVSFYSNPYGRTIPGWIIIEELKD